MYRSMVRHSVAPTEEYHSTEKSWYSPLKIGITPNSLASNDFTLKLIMRRIQLMLMNYMIVIFQNIARVSSFWV